MILKTTQLIADGLKKEHIACEIVEEDDGSSYVYTTFWGDNVDANVYFISEGDDGPVSVRCLRLADVPEDMEADMLTMIDRLHNEYLYVRFFLDSHSRLSAGYDIPTRTANLDEVACEMYLRFSLIIDEVMPEVAELLGIALEHDEDEE